MEGIVSRRGSGRMVTFGMPHVLKAFQMLRRDGFVSRASFGAELRLGGGAVKTLVSHMKGAGMAGTARSGTFLTGKGSGFFAWFEAAVGAECAVPRCGLFRGSHNHAVILRGRWRAVRTGLEQRDLAIMYGAAGCATLLYRGGRFVFPGDGRDCLRGDAATKGLLSDGLSPEEEDVVIVASADDPLVAELSAKNAALGTIAAG